MYVTEDKVFLHMVKSAGISVHQGLINSEQTINFNMRHASINLLPEKYKNFERYTVIRKPEDWYKSFYKFFYNVEGYLSFMLKDPLPADENGIVYLKPLDFNEFVRRSINFKDTLIKYPNKARVFNNILRSQGNIHFITSYFDTAIDIDKDNNFGDLTTLDQFDMSLYEFFWKNIGGDTAINIPMNRLDKVEEIFNIKIPHSNKTKNKIEANYDVDTLKLVRKTHEKFYKIYEEGQKI